MNQQGYVSFAEIVRQIKSLSKKRETGTLFITTKANRSAQIMLEDGRVVYLSCCNKRGRDALTRLKEIQGGRFRFQPGRPMARPMELPPTSELIEELRRAAGLSTPSSDGRRRGGGQNTVLRISAAQRSELEAALTSYIGPVASIICEEALDTAPDLATAVDVMAAEIPVEENAVRFREAALRGMER